MKQIEALEILKTGSNVFLTGEAGSGKSYTISQFVDWLKEEKKGYAITASTGIAASHINGTTIHSWIGMGIRRNLTKEQVNFIKNNEWIREKIKETQVLIIDEISMLDAINLNDIDAILRAILSKGEPFGGMQVVFVGDFFQLPPVSKWGEEMQFAFDSVAWEMARPVTCYLTEQHRQHDPEFLEILTAMRTGTVTDAHKARLAACTLPTPPQTQLFTHNADVESLNDRELAKLQGKPKTFQMISGGNPKLVEVLKRQCLSPETLVLKQGAVVMFTRNNFNKGYVNGTIGTVTGFVNGMPQVKTQDGQTVVPEMAEWTFEEHWETKAYIKQIPLRLAWAVTVHKSQGMSLDTARIDLSRTFEFGQGYVAISRVRTLAGLHLIGLNDEVYKMHPRVIEQDVVFREAAEHAAPSKLF